MKSEDYWNMFMETGMPEYYLVFQACKRTEDERVSENTGTCAPGHGVQ